MDVEHNRCVHRFNLQLLGHSTTVTTRIKGLWRPTTSSDLSRGPVPPTLRAKWIQRLLSFTCCNVTPKNTKLLSNSCSSLNYLTHYYIIPTGCAPDKNGLTANLLSVAPSFFLLLFFLTAHRGKRFLHFLLPLLCISPPVGHWVCPPVVDSLSVILARLTGYLWFMPALTSCVPLERQMDVCNTRFSAEWWIVCLSK